MKFLISLFVVFLMIGFVAAPAMACDHNCGDCSNDDCGHDHNDDSEGGNGDDGDNGDDDHGGCSGDSCHI